MALINCPECSKSVSNEAPCCPSCGYPIKPPSVQEKKTGLWWGLGCLLAVPAVLMVVAIVGMLAAIAIPSFMRARETSQLNGCVNNMKMIHVAKEKTALAHQYREGANIPESELSQFLKRDFNGLMCHKGGRYTVNPVGQDPACSVHGKLSESIQNRVMPNHTSDDIGAEAAPLPQR